MPVLSFARPLLSCVVFSMFFLSGQASNNMEVAEALKSQYEKHSVALTSSKTTYEFNYDGDTKSLYITEFIEYEYLALVPNALYDCYIPYDEFSKVEKIRLVNEKNFRQKIDPLYTSYQSDDVFHSDAKLCVVRIAFPNKGEVRKISAQKRYNDIRYLTRTVFQSDIPTVNREIVFKIPSWLSLKLIPFNFDKLAIKQNEALTKDGYRLISYTAENLAHVPDEPLSDGPSFYNPHILYYPESATVELQQPLMSSTLLQYQWYTELTNELAPDLEVIKNQVDKIIAEAESEQHKIELMFRWVQENIRYLAYAQGIMGFKPDEAHNVLFKKYGDCKGMANLLTQMLKMAGFDARFSWLGTNYLCYDYSIPSLAVDNHCIATLFYNDQTYYLDATEKYLPMGMIAERIQGRQIMIEDGERFIINKIPEGKSIDNKTTQHAIFKINDNQLIGDVSLTFAGESKASLFHTISTNKSDLNQEFVEELFHGSDNNITVNQSHYGDLFNMTKPFKVDAEVTVKNRITNFGKETYLIFDWDKSLKSMQIKEDRQTDLYFGQKFYIEKEIDFIIPSNLKITHLPQAVDIQTPDYSLRGHIEEKEQKLTYSLVIDIKNPRVKKDNFNQWNDAIRKLTAFYDDQIILTEK